VLGMTDLVTLSIDLLQIHRPPACPAHDQIEIPIPVEIPSGRSRQCGGRDGERGVPPELLGGAGPLVPEQHESVALRAHQQIEIPVTIQIREQRRAPPARLDLLELVAHQREPRL
jgi:hypothetical protein